MRVAVYDPKPRICGVTVWGENIVHGFRALGHECQLITVTKSGKPSKSLDPDFIEKHRAKAFADKGILWYAKDVDLTIKLDEVGEALNAFDLIVLVEPSCPPQEKEAERNLDIPNYYWALKNTKTPWVTHVHGAYYTAYAQQIEENFALPNFRGFTYYQDWYFDFKPFNSMRTLYPNLRSPANPYVPQFDVEAPHQTAKSFSYTGRIELVKGLNYLMFAADKLPEDWRMDLYGAATVSRSPSISRLVAEMLVKLGFEISWVYDAGALAALERGMEPVLKGFPWTARKGKHTVEYHGAYAMQPGIKRLTYHSTIPVEFGSMIYSAVTSPTFNRGFFELTSLEAIDAGAIGIHSDCQLVEETSNFDVVWLKNHMPLPGNILELPRLLKEDKTWEDQVNSFLKCVEEAVEITEDQQRFRKMIVNNRRALRATNDPAISATNLLKVAQF